MSFQSAIPWQGALQQSLPPLHRLETILNNQCCRTMIFQRTATTPLTPCLSPRVHSTNAVPCPAPPSRLQSGSFYLAKKRNFLLGLDTTPRQTVHFRAG